METAARVARRNYSATQFLDSNDAAYRQVWQILGQKWGNLLLDAAFASTISSGNQKQFSANFTVTDDQRERLMNPLHAMGWYDGMPLGSGTYPNLLMQGMSFKGMIAMVRMVLTACRDEALNLTFERMFALGGQRARNDKLDGTVEQIYASLNARVRRHTWVNQQMKLMDEPDCLEPFKGAFATEFELFILAILVATSGRGRVNNVVLTDDSDLEALDKIPARTIESHDIVLSESMVIKVINAPAERRGRGEARPTSKNNVKHWMRLYGVNDGDTVVITASRNGTARVLATSEAMMHSINDTITVLGFAGPPEGTPESHFVAMLSETANMVLKAAEAYLNRLLPNGAKPLTSRDIKPLLDRLAAAPTPETVSDIVDEIALDLVSRAG
jgi:hypothetical protein